MAKDSISQILKLNSKQLSPLSSKRIHQDKIQNDELIFFKISNGELGPYYYKHIQNFLNQYTNFPRNTPVRTMNSKQWVPFYSLDYFDRRKEPSRSLTSESGMYLLLINGQQQGPFGIEQLKQKVAQKEILLTDIVSADLGKTWNKIYNIPEFDRRKRECESLPYRPGENTFIGSLQEIIEEGSSEQGNQEALVKLAMIGHVKANNVSEENATLEDEQSNPDNPTNNEKRSSWRFTAAIFLLLAASIGTFIVDKKQKISKVEKTDKAIQNQDVNKPQKISQKSKFKRSKSKNFKRIPASSVQKPKRMKLKRKAPKPVETLPEERDEKIYEDERIEDEDLFEDDYAEYPEERSRQDSRKEQNLSNTLREIANQPEQETSTLQRDSDEYPIEDETLDREVDYYEDETY